MTYNHKPHFLLFLAASFMNERESLQGTGLLNAPLWGWSQLCSFFIVDFQLPDFDGRIHQASVCFQKKHPLWYYSLASIIISICLKKRKKHKKSNSGTMLYQRRGCVGRVRKTREHPIKPDLRTCSSTDLDTDAAVGTGTLWGSCWSFELQLGNKFLRWPESLQVCTALAHV